jgi:gliding motility-associated transport system permease protein
MRAISIIFKRELGAYVRSPAGWVIAALLLLIDGVLFQSQALNGEQLSAVVLSKFFWSTSGVTMIAAIALSIRLIAEERQQHSMVLLNTSPVRDVEIVLGKFFAALVFLAGMILMSVYMPLLIKVHGKVNFAQIAVGYVGLFLLGSASLAIGMFASALTRGQLVAAVAGAAMLALFVLFYQFSRVLDPPLKGIFSELDIWWEHFQASFMNGIFNLKDVVYYLAVTYLFLLLTVKTLEAKRWT